MSQRTLSRKGTRALFNCRARGKHFYHSKCRPCRLHALAFDCRPHEFQACAAPPRHRKVHRAFCCLTAGENLCAEGKVSTEIRAVNRNVVDSYKSPSKSATMLTSAGSNIFKPNPRRTYSTLTAARRRPGLPCCGDLASGLGAEIT